ncbi:MAG TPA: hypothetical protein PKO06_21945, partial [Candidatus Ozemobacteraceae bacterium]|nr:hypothetical protein [Candidatus Ozemobacteraceae bacterium]
MSGPMRSFLVLNGAVLVFLAIVWWADGQIPFDRIKASADHAASLDKLHASLASSTTFVEAHDVASRSTVLAERLNRRLVSLADLLLRTRELIGIQWWLMVWVLFSNAILVSGLQEGRSASLENEPQAEREFQLRLVPITIFGWVCFMLFGLVTGEEVAVSNWTWPVFGFIWTSVVMAIITRYMKIAVSPV